MKTYNLLLIILAMMFSCSINDDSDNFEATNIDAHFDFIVVNANNENLFDPATVNNWDVNTIKLFYIKDNEPVLYSQPNSEEAPNGCLLINQLDDYTNILRVFMNYDPVSEKSITYVQWNDSRTDTLEVTYNKINGYQKKEVWFNGEKVWDYITMMEDYYFHKLVIN